MEEEVDTTIYKVFSDISSANSVRLIPWCISTAASPNVIPIHHLREALATALQLGVDAPAVTPAPVSEGPHALAPTGSPVCHSETPPPPILLLSDIPYISNPQYDVCMLGSSSIPSMQSGIVPPMVHPMIDLEESLC